ncbi:protoporphyrinogen oxidase [Chromobacterium sphagni]|uniref:Protoporphyrinogen oxidase n=1 Tax=Chromobacterium sphagni TaxID=1903179 RepID=A0A1S1X4S2_9NEIS|nr:protoporphyrinogen oxidase [Chromobacterium sphagni]OHX14468.1 protoporphyrinogen oxidase [Chromobacterium sphagni]
MIAVIGAGVSGLSCAWWLREQGLSARVFESSGDVGGKVRTLSAGMLCEAGPNTLLADEALLRWFSRLGLTPLWPAPGCGQRHVLLRGEYCRLPGGPLALLAGDFLTWPAKRRLLSGLLRHGGPQAGQASLAAFCRERFGAEVLERLLDPLVSGIFAGDPEELLLAETLPALAVAAQQPGPLWRALLRTHRRSGRRRVCTLDGGLQSLPRRLAQDLQVRLDSPVLELARAGGAWRLRTAAGWERFDRVVLALPADRAAVLLQPLAPKPAALCLRVPYAPVAVASTLVRASALARPLPGFGGLHPGSEAALALGHLMSSNLYPHVCRPGERLLTSFIGGRRQAGLMALDDEALLALLNRELERLFGLRERPLAQRLTRWPTALPQGTAVQGELRAAFAPWAERGLHLCVNWLDGASLPDCLEKGRRLALSIASRDGPALRRRR